MGSAEAMEIHEPALACSGVVTGARHIPYLTTYLNITARKSNPTTTEAPMKAKVYTRLDLLMPEPEELAVDCAVGIEAAEAAICSIKRDIARRLVDCSTGADVKAIHRGYHSSCRAAKQIGQDELYAL